ncbi:MAG: winged helix DNA-binding protein [Sphingopyxis sp.]|nr:winged helix DNA-binding protein [Sphingopyxis sp.]
MCPRARHGVQIEADASRLDRLEVRLDYLVILLEKLVAQDPTPFYPPEGDLGASLPTANAPQSAPSVRDTAQFHPCRKSGGGNIVHPTSFPKARARAARDAIRQRRKREDHFPSELFADPGWDIMLDLYAAHYEGEAVSVSSLCIAAAVPQTTALRWINMMANDGWLVRQNDPTDGRRTYLKLSDEGRSRLDSYFDNLPY